MLLKAVFSEICCLSSGRQMWSPPSKALELWLHTCVVFPPSGRKVGKYTPSIPSNNCIDATRVKDVRLLRGYLILLATGMWPETYVITSVYKLQVIMLASTQTLCQFYSWLLLINPSLVMLPTGNFLLKWVYFRMWNLINILIQTQHILTHIFEPFTTSCKIESWLEYLYSPMKKVKYSSEKLYLYINQQKFSTCTSLS